MVYLKSICSEEVNDKIVNSMLKKMMKDDSYFLLS